MEEKKVRAKLIILDQEYHQIKSHIDTLTKERLFDQLLVQRLKKRKLHLKDQITYLRESLCDDIIA
jgi:hypothetical protein